MSKNITFKFSVEYNDKYIVTCSEFPDIFGVGDFIGSAFMDFWYVLEEYYVETGKKLSKKGMLKLAKLFEKENSKENNNEKNNK